MQWSLQVLQQAVDVCLRPDCWQAACINDTLLLPAARTAAGVAMLCASRALESLYTV